MNTIQDILIFESGDGGEMLLQNGDIATTTSMVNGIYLALFGGNIEQSTSNQIQSGDERLDWWGNIFPELDFNSEFERTLLEVVLNSSGLSKLENAAKKDLKILSDFCDFSVNCSIIGVDKLSLEIQLNEPNKPSKLIQFIWDGLRNEIITNMIL